MAINKKGSVMKTVPNEPIFGGTCDAVKTAITDGCETKIRNATLACQGSLEFRNRQLRIAKATEETIASDPARLELLGYLELLETAKTKEVERVAV